MTNDKPETGFDPNDPLAFRVSGMVPARTVTVRADELDQVSDKFELLALALRGLEQRVNEHADICGDPGDQQYALGLILDLARQVSAELTRLSPTTEEGK